MVEEPSTACAERLVLRILLKFMAQNTSTEHKIVSEVSQFLRNLWEMTDAYAMYGKHLLRSMV